MASGEQIFNAAAAPSTPAAGKVSAYVGTDKLLHLVDESGANGLEAPLYFARLTADYTLTSTTNSQKAFNVPSAGSLTVPSSTGFFFEALLVLTGMSATSGNLGFDILGAGTATISNQQWVVHGLDQTTQTTPGAITGTQNSAALAADMVTAGTGTAVHALIKGTFNVTTGGTIIPSIKLTTAAAAAMKAGSYIQFTRIGANTVNNVGAWT